MKQRRKKLKRKKKKKKLNKIIIKQGRKQEITGKRKKTKNWLQCYILLNQPWTHLLLTTIYNKKLIEEAIRQEGRG